MSIAQQVTVGLAKLGLALKTQAQSGATKLGLSPTQGEILALLGGRAEPLRLSAVAEALGVKAGTASEAVRALVQKGFVQKGRAKDDARAAAISLTASGAKAAAEVQDWPDFLLEAVDALSAQEQQVFLSGAMKMIKRLQDEGRIPLARMCTGCRFFSADAHPKEAKPHHCEFVDAPLGPGDARLDCGDFSPAPQGVADENFRLFILK